MAVSLIACPLCCQPGFETLESLRDNLINVATRPLMCPICHDVLNGLDKFTIHLFSHFLQQSLQANAEAEIRLPEATVDHSLETISVLESCGLRQDAQGLISKVGDEPKKVYDELEEIGIGLKEMDSTHKDELDRELATFLMPSGSRRADAEGPSVEEEAPPTPREAAPEPQLLHCPLCAFTFPDEHILALHQQLVHSGASVSAAGKQFGCHLCSKGFKMRGSLMVHLRVAHGGANLAFNAAPPDAEARKFVCATCGKSFKKDQHLGQHMKTHDGKQWACDVCQKFFTTKYFLKKHKRLHTGEMPYCCTVCNKTFTFQQSMHKHALYHRDDKPHACPDCNRTFKELSTLHNHRRIHTGEKPFSCETCGKCFRQRVSYLVHRRIHTGVMPYMCTACGKSFRYKVSERTHKCPSQPPGTVVRQAGELVQKLQQRAAQTTSQQQQYIVILDSDRRKADNLDAVVETADFFSMVENLPSPSERLSNLTLSPTPLGLPDVEDSAKVPRDLQQFFNVSP